MKRIRLGYDASVSLAPGGGGIARYTLELLRALVAANPPDFEFIVLLNSLRHAPDERLQFLFQAENVTVVQRRLPGPLIVEGWRLYGVPRWESLVGHECDLVHAPAMYIPPADAPVVVTVHDLAFLREGTGDALAGAYFLKDLPRRLPSVAHVITPSHCVAEEVSSTYNIDPRRISPIFHGIDGRLFHPHGRPDEAACDVFAVTQMDIPRKRAEWIQPVCERVAAQRSGLDVAVLGMSEEQCRPPLRSLGRVSDHVLAEYYRSSRATLLTTREEGFGFPLLESLASGTPVVSSRHSALGEIDGGFANFAEEDSQKALAEKILEVLDNPPDHAWRNAAAEHARSFTWEKCAAAVLELYREVAGA